MADLENKIEGIIAAINDCGQRDTVLLTREETRILVRVMEEALLALRERQKKS